MNFENANTEEEAVRLNDQGDPLRAGSGRRNTKDTL
jgi:hypothetical protein